MKTVTAAPVALALALVTAAAPLAAQTAAAAVAPHFVIDSVGPDGWRSRLGPTNLGSLLASEKGRELWQPHVLPLLAQWQQLLGGDDAALAGARERLLAYGGRVRLGLWLRGAADMTAPPVDVAVVLDGDGRTDMKALAADVRQLLRQLDGEWAPGRVGDHQVDVCTDGDGKVTAPFAHGAGVAFVAASRGDLEAAWRDAQAFAGEVGAKVPPPSTPALRLDYDVAGIVARLLAAGDAVGDDTAAALKAFGVDSLSRVQLTVGSAGPRVQLELAQHFTSAPRGLVAAFFPPATTVPALQRAMPEKLGAARVGHFDFGALFDTVLALVQAFGGETPDEVRAEMKKDLGIDVRDDLIAHLTTEVLVTGSPLAGLDHPKDFTWLVAVALRDAAKFTPALATMLDKAKPFLTRAETVTIEGVECERYGNMLGYDLWFAVGHGTFVFAGGRDAQEHVKATLAALAAPKPAAAEPPPAAAALRRHEPPGVSGRAYADIDTVFTVPLEWWLQPLFGLLPWADAVDDDPEARERVRELLRQHQLATLHSATGWADSVWRWRVWW